MVAGGRTLARLAPDRRRRAAVDAFADRAGGARPFLPVAVVYAVGLAASRGLGSMMPLVVVEKLGRGTGPAWPRCGFALTVTGRSCWSRWRGRCPTSRPWQWSRCGRCAACVPVGRIRAALAGRARQRHRPGLVRDFWRFSAPRALSRIFSVALQRFDIVIVGALRGPADAALYAAATRFPILGLMFVQAIQQVMAPKISEFLAAARPGSCADDVPHDDGVADARVLADLPDLRLLRRRCCSTCSATATTSAVPRGRDPVPGHAGGHGLRSGRLGAADGRAERAEPRSTPVWRSRSR